ncbi:MAG: helix-turn-helix domain-containing protein [Polyangiaceae bacterium]
MGQRARTQKRDGTCIVPLRRRPPLGDPLTGGSIPTEDGHENDATEVLFSGGVAAEAPTLGSQSRSPFFGRPVPSQVSALKDLAPPERLELEGDPSSEPARLLKALNDCGGNQTRAAQMLGISRRTLINRLDLHKLPRPRKGRGEPASR